MNDGTQISEVRVSAFDSRANAPISASVRSLRENIGVQFPTGVDRQYPASALPAICSEIVANPYPQWPILLGPSDAPFPARAELRRGSTEDLQLVVSLFHLVLGMLERSTWRWPLHYLADLIEADRGQVFFDRLPRRNRLYVPSRAIQLQLIEQCRGNPLDSLFFRLNRLYMLTLIDANDEQKHIFYRPYNTTIVPVYRLRDVEDLNSRMIVEHDRAMQESPSR